MVVAELEGGVRDVPPEERRVWSGLPVDPGLVPPGGDRIERMAFAPKLMRRTKGVVGAVRDEGSSSSMAFSSIESELLVEMLPRRSPPNAPAAEVGPGPPDRPSVVTERRR